MRTAITFVVAVFVSLPCFAAGKPLPAKQTLDAAKRLIAETFSKELAEPDKAPAVKAMLDAAESTTGDDPAQAALYLSAAEVAARSGDTRAAFGAVERLASVFDIDELATKGSILEMAADSAKSNDARVSIANRGLELADAAASAGRFDVADSALKAAASASAKVRDASLRKEIAAKRRSIEKARKQAEHVETEIAAARKKLESDPGNASANESIGKHLAFDRNDWAAGLKHLAKASDAQLRAVAVVDLESPSEPDSMAKAADLWWALADDTKNTRDRSGYRSRAVFWYTRAVGQLKGFAKTRVEKRIAEAGEEALAAAASQNGGENGKFIDLALAPGVVMRLVKIPASKDGNVKEFWLGQTEVTQRQWAAVMGSNPSGATDPQLPATNIGESGCLEFVGNLSEISTASRLAFRMPTTDEWAHAFCCDGDASEYAGRFADYGWVLQNGEGRVHPVASKQPNKRGLFDMLGNAWELTNEPHVIVGCAIETPCSAEDFKVDFKATTALYRNTASGKPEPAVGFRIAATPR